MKTDRLHNQILAADLAWVPVALATEQALCSGLKCRQIPLGASNFLVYVVCTVFAWILLSERLHLDGFRGGWRLPALVSRLVLALALQMALLLAVGSVSERYVGRVTLSVFSLFLLLGFLCIRGIALHKVLRRYRKGDVSRVVILGSGSLAVELAANFKRHPELLCEVAGFLSPEAEPPRRAPAPAPAPMPGNVSTMEIVGLLHRHKVNELVMAQASASNEILNLVALCRQQAIRVSLVPQPYELYLSRPTLLDLGGVPLLQLGDMSAPASALIGKRLLDIGLGFALAVAALPLVAMCAAALRFSTGRAFRWERRTGWRGVRFSMLRLNVDRRPSGPNLAASHRFERLLSELSISELPQFWNVLRGEMSLVGPRPESPERVNRYSNWQQQRLSAKPGMTGLAQVQGLREQHLSEDKTRLDLQYMLRPSLLKDISLVVETIWTLSLRLVSIRRIAPAIAVADGGSAAPSILYSTSPHSTSLYSPSSQPFPEMLQHAHRTQSGTD